MILSPTFSFVTIWLPRLTVLTAIIRGIYCGTSFLSHQPYNPAWIPAQTPSRIPFKPPNPSLSLSHLRNPNLWNLHSSIRWCFGHYVRKREDNNRGERRVLHHPLTYMLLCKIIKEHLFKCVKVITTHYPLTFQHILWNNLLTLWHSLCLIMFVDEVCDQFWLSVMALVPLQIKRLIQR